MFRLAAPQCWSIWEEISWISLKWQYAKLSKTTYNLWNRATCLCLFCEIRLVRLPFGRTEVQDLSPLFYPCSPLLKKRRQHITACTFDMRPVKAYKDTELNFSPWGNSGISKQVSWIGRDGLTEMLESKGHLVSGVGDRHNSWASRMEPTHSHACLLPVTHFLEQLPQNFFTIP